MAVEYIFLHVRCRWCDRNFGDPEYFRDFAQLDREVRGHVRQRHAAPAYVTPAAKPIRLNELVECVLIPDKIEGAA